MSIVDNSVAYIEESSLYSGKLGISAAVLKNIAIITMLIDHIGFAIIEKYISYLYDTTLLTNSDIDLINSLYVIDNYMRIIGRIAFPIFCFLLVEGFYHTRNIRMYVFRLTLFALVSEIPFDMAFFHTSFDWGHQNVFFTLLIGLLVIWACEDARKKFVNIDTIFRKLVYYILTIAIIAIGSYVAMVLNTDYDALGVIIIALIYHFRKVRIGALLCGLIALYSFSWELVGACIGLIPIKIYNGKRGRQNKYFFYLFYPIHLMILYMIYNMLVA